MPHFQTRTLDSMHTLVELAGDEIGYTAAVDYALGEVYRNMGYPGLISDGGGYTDRTGNPVPSEYLVRDFLLHESLLCAPPRVSVWTEVSGVGQVAPLAQWRLTALRLPLRETIDHLGRAPEVLGHPLLPGYENTVSWACRHVGWDIGAFEVFRCRVEYPLPHTVLLTEFDLPGPR